MKRFAFAAAMAAGIGFAQTQTLAQVLTPSVDQPEAFRLDQITNFTTQEVLLPRHAGEPFRAMVELGGEMVLLDLTPHSVRSPNLVVMVNDETGRHELTDLPAPATYRGHVDGQPDSAVTASLVESQLSAMIDTEEGWFWVIEPMSQYEPGANPTTHVVYRSFEVDQPDTLCGVADDALMMNDDQPATGYAPEVTKILDLAIDNDYEYFQLRGSTNAMISDIEQTINRVDYIYQRDVDVIIEISHMELRTTSNDPYTTNEASQLLNQFTNYWSSNMRSITYDLAELFSGRNFNGGTIGIAWLNVVCDKSRSYSAIQTSGLSLTYRVGVSAHELGHNFAAQHCSGSDCRIMCPGLGGCAGDISRFGQQSKNTIRSAASRARCMVEPDPPAMALPFSDPFPSTSFTPDTWATTTSTTITTGGLNPLSPPYAATMNRVATLETIDVLVSPTIYPTPIFVSYWVQPRAVEAGETLEARYKDAAGVWQTLETIVSDGSNPFGFAPSEFKLNQAAYSDKFRFSLRAFGDDANDIWYIDDVSVSARCLADINKDGTLDIFDFLGYQDLFVASSPKADLTGDGSHDIFDFLAYQDMFVKGCY